MNESMKIAIVYDLKIVQDAIVEVVRSESRYIELIGSCRFSELSKTNSLNTWIDKEPDIVLLFITRPLESEMEILQQVFGSLPKTKLVVMAAEVHQHWQLPPISYGRLTVCTGMAIDGPQIIKILWYVHYSNPRFKIETMEQSHGKAQQSKSEIRNQLGYRAEKLSEAETDLAAELPLELLRYLRNEGFRANFGSDRAEWASILGKLLLVSKLSFAMIYSFSSTLPMESMAYKPQ